MRNPITLFITLSKIILDPRCTVTVTLTAHSLYWIENNYPNDYSKAVVVYTDPALPFLGLLAFYTAMPVIAQSPSPYIQKILNPKCNVPVTIAANTIYWVANKIEDDYPNKYYSKAVAEYTGLALPHLNTLSFYTGLPLIEKPILKSTYLKNIPLRLPVEMLAVTHGTNYGMIYLKNESNSTLDWMQQGYEHHILPLTDLTAAALIAWPRIPNDFLLKKKVAITFYAITHCSLAGLDYLENTSYNNTPPSYAKTHIQTATNYILPAWEITLLYQIVAPTAKARIPSWHTAPWTGNVKKFLPQVNLIWRTPDIIEIQIQRAETLLGCNNSLSNFLRKINNNYITPISKNIAISYAVNMLPLGKSLTLYWVHTIRNWQQHVDHELLSFVEDWLNKDLHITQPNTQQSIKVWVKEPVIALCKDLMLDTMHRGSSSASLATSPTKLERLGLKVEEAFKDPHKRVLCNMVGEFAVDFSTNIHNSASNPCSWKEALFNLYNLSMNAALDSPEYFSRILRKSAIKTTVQGAESLAAQEDSIGNPGGYLLVAPFRQAAYKISETKSTTPTSVYPMFDDPDEYEDEDDEVEGALVPYPNPIDALPLNALLLFRALNLDADLTKTVILSLPATNGFTSQNSLQNQFFFPDKNLHCQLVFDSAYPMGLCYTTLDLHGNPQVNEYGNMAMTPYNHESMAVTPGGLFFFGEAFFVDSVHLDRIIVGMVCSVFRDEACD